MQKLDQLRQQYALPFITHLVRHQPTTSKAASNTSNTDPAGCHSYATGHDTTLNIADTPTTDQVHSANLRLSAHINTESFAAEAYAVGTELWANAVDVSGVDSERAAATATALKMAMPSKPNSATTQAPCLFRRRMVLGRKPPALIGTASHRRRLCIQTRHFAHPCPQPGHQRLNAAHITRVFSIITQPYTAVGHNRVLNLSSAAVSVKLRP